MHRRTREGELRVFMLEDSEGDARLIEEELRSAGLNPLVQRVETRESFAAGLEDFRPDVILADFMLPAFDGLSALELARNQCPQVPFIVVSGTLAEDSAVELLRQGARDYILKDRLARLPQAVRRSVEEARLEAAAREAQEMFRLLFEEAMDGIVLIDAETGCARDCNAEFEHQTGRAVAELRVMPVWELCPPALVADSRRLFEEVLRNGEGGSSDLEFRRPVGTDVPVDIRAKSLRLRGKLFVQTISRDITERRQSERRLQEQLEELQRERQVVQRSKRQWLDTVDSIRNPIMVHDDEFRIVRANKAYAERADMPVGDLIGKPYWTCFPRRDGPLPECRAAVAKAKAGRNREHEEEFTLDTGEIFISRVFDVHEPQSLQEYSLHIFEDVTRKRYGEQMLRQSEQRLSGIVNCEAMLVCRLDLRGHLTYMNEEFARVFATKIGDSIWGKIHPEDFATVKGALATLQQAPYRCTVEGRADVAGEWRWVLWQGAAIRDPDGNMVEVQGVGFDITARKQAEKARAELAAIVASSMDAIYSSGIDGNITVWNVSAERLFGYAEAEVLGRPVAVLVPPELRDQFFPIRDRVVAGEEMRNLEVTRLRKDGTRIEVSLTLSPIRDAAGNVVAVSAIAHDITERLKGENQLRLFRTLIDKTQDEIHVVDPESLRILDTNEAMCRNLGYTREELLSMRISDISIATSFDIERVHARVAESGQAVFEACQKRKDGSTYPVEVITTLISAGKGYTVAVTRDITERKQAERAMLKVNRLLRTLGAGNEALVRAKDEPGLLEEMCRIVVEIGGYAMAWVGYAVNDAAKSVEPKACVAIPENVLRNAAISWGDNERGQAPVSKAIRSGEPQIALVGDAAFGPFREILADAHIASVAGLPLRLQSGDPPFGAIGIAASDQEAFDGEELKLLEQLANDLAYGIASLRAGVERRAAGDQLRRSLETTIAAIAGTVEMRDPYTAGHQRRVAQLAAAIVREMELPEKVVEGVHFGALLHDVGKIQVSAELLSKPTRLSRVEFAIIKSHAQSGYDIIKGIDFPWPVAQMVLQHHERLDGSGYPSGLKGDEITLEARILMVADQVEAMCSHRPYRPSLGIEPALLELEKGRGIAFDAQVVDGCLRLFREKHFEFLDG